MLTKPSFKIRASNNSIEHHIFAENVAINTCHERLDNTGLCQFVKNLVHPAQTLTVLLELITLLVYLRRGVSQIGPGKIPYPRMFVRVNRTVNIYFPLWLTSHCARFRHMRERQSAGRYLRYYTDIRTPTSCGCPIDTQLSQNGRPRPWYHSLEGPLCNA